MTYNPLRVLSRSVGSVNKSDACVVFRVSRVEAAFVVHATEEATVFVQYLRVCSNSISDLKPSASRLVRECLGMLRSVSSDRVLKSGTGWFRDAAMPQFLTHTRTFILAWRDRSAPAGACCS
jgi:hypothetical protein